MRPETAKYLRDMRDAAGAIQDETRGRTLQDFLRVRPLRDAANWNFCVIGEALTQLSRIDESTARRITDRAKIIGFRNQLIHGYGVIDNHITWDIVQNKLPILIREVDLLLSE